MNVLIPLACCCAAILSAPTHATAIYRCVDSNGHATFTTHGCSSSAGVSTITAHNPSPGGYQGPLMPPAASHDISAINTLTVVGGRDDGCGNTVTGRERREALIRKDIRAGMTQRDIESMLGRPNRITARNGKTRYDYQDRQGNKWQVTFDENNCVLK
ncbi:DUF4124 domain-containing protein [Pseudomonas matsuisoli]|nr:DUF4124 domain-containing protein [Pseudomonas matsuisoli]